jgi:two-component system OmpR family response regulator
MEKRLVLVADDNESIRELYSTALSLVGIEAITASSGAQAIAIALEKHPDVILMDIMMPGIDGHETVEKIRADSWGKSAKIIYLTNLSEPTDVAKAFAQKPEEYIIKAHTDVKEVVNKVRTALYQS